MNIDTRFPKQVAVALASMAAVATYPLLKYGSREVIDATIAGAVLATINVLLGYAAIEYSFDKSYTTFLKAVLGGMGVRMLIMLLALAVLIKLFGFHPAALTLSLLGFYIIYLMLEILFIQRKLFIKNQG